MRYIELLSPARDMETAREAILHGADAVYIGGPRFGARAAAGNSLEDIRCLVEFAHVYGVRVYVTLNTILYDEELGEVRRLVWELYDMKVDALIVQDMAFLEMDLPPIALHASTQMDNRDARKVGLLHELGFEQAVLARELTIDEIESIHNAVPQMNLEVFVHGATCVSYNGQCYASQHCFGRSANRGECAQFCRLPFDLVDSDGRVVCDAHTGKPVRQRHLLSLRDMNRSRDVEALMDAGVVSFKIEGRLKDAAYVKNVTAYYRKCIDEVLRRRPNDYQRTSLGISDFTFVPQLDKTFNRGFSNYFLHGRTHDMVQLYSPKSLGQLVGHVKEIRRNCFTVSTTVPFANGDGLCFVDADGNLQGCRVNRVEGNCLYPKDMPKGLLPRMPLYRNYDQLFLQILGKSSAQRRIPVAWSLSETVCTDKEGSSSVALRITLSVNEDVSVSQVFDVSLDVARTPQHDNVVRQLSRLGDTPFVCSDVNTDFSREWFIPSSVLGDWRRAMTEKLVRALRISHEEKLTRHTAVPLRSSHVVPAAFEGGRVTYMANVSNHLARQWYERNGAVYVDSAMELTGQGDVLMTLRYCPRHELGMCGKPLVPLFLRSADGRCFPLSFDCRNCQVCVLAPAKVKGR